MGKRFAIVIGVVAAGVAALGAQTAAADSVHHGTTQIHHSTTVTLGYYESQHFFFGWVSSGPDQCERGRTVKLLYTPSGDPDPTGSEDRTDDKGLWAMSWGVLEAGNYQARATRKTFTRAVPGRKHICEPGESPVFVWTR